MSFTTDLVNDVAVVRLPERLALADVPEARRRILQLIEDGHRNLVLDLAKVVFVDSSGLSVFVTVQGAAQAAGGDVVLLDPTPPVRSLIELTRLQEVFEIFGHEGNAVQRMSCARVA